ncbi:MAG: GNAT family N-acetyltransferase [Verrucomicrobiales bacterium]
MIRLATSADAATISTIYNYYVLNSTATYQEEPESLDNRLRWLEAHGAKHPVTVAEVAGEIVGWAALNPFHARSAYRFTVENSVYIHHQHHRCGLGRALLSDLIERARILGYHSILAGISADQAASLRLHSSLGFTEAARLQEVGFKFGRWLDVVYLQLLLQAGRD